MHIYLHTHWYFLFVRNVWGEYWLHSFDTGSFLPVISVNIITITADHNLFSWLQIHETNCCDATAWSKQEQAAKQPKFHQLLQLKGSSTEKKSKSLPLPLGSHLCSHAAFAPEMLQTCKNYRAVSWCLLNIYNIHQSFSYLPEKPGQQILSGNTQMAYLDIESSLKALHS